MLLAEVAQCSTCGVPIEGRRIIVFVKKGGLDAIDQVEGLIQRDKGGFISREPA